MASFVGSHGTNPSDAPGLISIPANLCEEGASASVSPVFFLSLSLSLSLSRHASLWLLKGSEAQEAPWSMRKYYVPVCGAFYEAQVLSLRADSRGCGIDITGMLCLGKGSLAIAAWLFPGGSCRFTRMLESGFQKHDL